VWGYAVFCRTFSAQRMALAVPVDFASNACFGHAVTDVQESNGAVSSDSMLLRILGQRGGFHFYPILQNHGFHFSIVQNHVRKCG
jgi:hypothetical protein